MKEAVFTMKLEPELRNAFMAAAESAHRPESQLMRELMREYVQRQQAAEGLVFSAEEVEKEFASLRGDRDAE